jgi:benzodiazapine receptor
MKQFFEINKTAGYLFVPYLAWVTFATALTASIWKRNKVKSE